MVLGKFNVMYLVKEKAYGCYPLKCTILGYSVKSTLSLRIQQLGGRALSFY